MGQYLENGTPEFGAQGWDRTARGVRTGCQKIAGGFVGSNVWARVGVAVNQHMHCVNRRATTAILEYVRKLYP